MRADSSHAQRPVLVDAMGGDFAPRAIVEGALLAQDDGLPVRLVGRTPDLKPWLPRSGIEVVHASDVVAMDEAAVSAVRRSEDSSLRVALRELAAGNGSAVVSCGNTGAALVAAVFDLGMLEGVERPAVATRLPRADGRHLVLLDAGGNVDVRPELLVTFAVLGAAYAQALGIPEPRVGLLSNGSEDSKGNQLVRHTLPLLRETGLRVVGPVEPTTAFEGGCDVLVTDGFTGNVLLKSAEGAVTTITSMLRAEIGRSTVGRLGAMLLGGALRRFRQQVAWDVQGGAVLLGARGTVVIGHGRATPEAVRHAIRLAHRSAQARLVARVERGLAARTANG